MSEPEIALGIAEEVIFIGDIVVKDPCTGMLRKSRDKGTMAEYEKAMWETGKYEPEFMIHT